MTQPTCLFNGEPKLVPEAIVWDWLRIGPPDLTEDEWKRDGRDFVGGSDIASILGSPDAFTNRTTLWQRLRSAITDRPTPTDTEPTERMVIGSLVEPAIVAAASTFAHPDKSVFPVAHTWRLSDVGLRRFIAASPDYLYAPTRTTRGIGECKNVAADQRHKWFRSGELCPPERVRMQAEWNAGVLNATEYTIAIFVGGSEFHHVTYEADEVIFDCALEKVEAFVQSAMLDLPPGPHAGHPDTPTVWADQYPPPDDPPVPFDLDDAGLVAADYALALAELKANRDAADLEYRTARDHVIAALAENDATDATVNDELLATWRPDKNGRRRFVTKETN